MQTPIFSHAAALLCIAFYFTSCSDANHQSVSTSEAAMEAPREIQDKEKKTTESRKIIKTAEIQLQVHKVETEVNQIQQCLQNLGGHISHYEVKNEIGQTKNIQTKLDSTCLQQEIHPTAYLKISIPKSQGDSFIRYMLNRDARIENFLMDEKDITEDLNALNEHATHAKENNLPNANIHYDKEELSINQKAEANTLAYRTKSIWLDVRLNGDSYMINEMKPLPPSGYGPFSVRFLSALESGWEILSVLLIIIVSIWPFLLLGGLIYIIVFKKFFGYKALFVRNKPTQNSL